MPQDSTIERDYVVAELLPGLADHRLRDIQAFLGDTGSRRFWYEGYGFGKTRTLL